MVWITNNRRLHKQGSNYINAARSLNDIYFLYTITHYLDELKKKNIYCKFEPLIIPDILTVGTLQLDKYFVYNSFENLWLEFICPSKKRTSEDASINIWYANDL